MSRWLVAWCLWCLSGWALAQSALLPVPTLSARVTDQTGTLSAPDLAGLEAKLAAFESQRGSQVVVLMVSTTAPEDIADYTQRVGDAWKVGRADVGDGVILLVAKDDRRVRIATARAVEGAIPDLVAHRIIEQAIAPAFRQGRYAEGLHAGIDQIFGHLSGEALPLPGDPATDSGTDADDWVDLLVFVGFAAPVVAAVLRQVLGSRLGSVVAGLAIGGMTWHLSQIVWLAVIVGLLGVLVSLVIAHLPATPAGPAARRLNRFGRGEGWPQGGGGRGWGSGGGGGFRSGGGGGFGGGGASGGW